MCHGEESEKATAQLYIQLQFQTADNKIVQTVANVSALVLEDFEGVNIVLV